MKITIFLMAILIMIFSFQMIQQNRTINELYRVIESHHETLILQHNMMAELAQQNIETIDMLKVIQGKMIWGGDW